MRCGCIGELCGLCECMSGRYDYMGELCGLCERSGLHGGGEVVWVSMWLRVAAWW